MKPSSPVRTGTAEQLESNPTLLLQRGLNYWFTLWIFLWSWWSLARGQRSTSSSQGQQKEPLTPCNKSPPQKASFYFGVALQFRKSDLGDYFKAVLPPWCTTWKTDSSRKELEVQRSPKTKAAIKKSSWATFLHSSDTAILRAAALSLLLTCTGATKSLPDSKLSKFSLVFTRLQHFS